MVGSDERHGREPSRRDALLRQAGAVVVALRPERWTEGEPIAEAFVG